MDSGAREKRGDQPPSEHSMYSNAAWFFWGRHNFHFQWVREETESDRWGELLLHGFMLGTHRFVKKRVRHPEKRGAGLF
jgi:hypothetical protein